MEGAASAGNSPRRNLSTSPSSRWWRSVVGTALRSACAWWIKQITPNGRGVQFRSKQGPRCRETGFRNDSARRTALLDNWIWGLSLIALTIAIHATGVTFMVSVLHSIRVRLESRNLRLPHTFAIVIVAITAMGLLLAALHGIEAALWAAAYLWLGALGSPETAILYSVDSMATRGDSGFMLQPHWQMMGALEAADGMLLFGISTAFSFTVMQFYYVNLVLRAPPDGSTGAE
jgi:hypothetical protein